jgi:hypothetical protein
LNLHVQQRHGLELAGAGERAGIDRPHAAVGDELHDLRLVTLVVAGDEDIQRLAVDLPAAVRRNSY